MTVRICKKCVNPSTRPNVIMDKDGICAVCKMMDENKAGNIDWKQRKQEIFRIKQWGQKNTKSIYDCIVTVSGGKDSTKQAFFARDELGMNPLLVSVIYPPEQSNERGPKNLANLIEHGFDCIKVGPNPYVSKYLVKHCFKKFFNIFNAPEMALYAGPIHVAIAENIPLIFLGENPALTIGEKHGKLNGDASKMRNANTLMGGEADIFQDENITRQNLHFYNYPSEEDVEYAGLRIVYLGYYIQDWTGFNNAEFAIKRGLETRNDKPEDIGDLWGNGALDEDFTMVNQLMKFVKFGFGRVTDQVQERIHAEEMTREEGFELIEAYDGNCSREYIQKFCNYIDITYEEFLEMLEEHRDKKLFKKNDKGDWKVDRQI